MGEAAQPGRFVGPGPGAAAPSRAGGPPPHLWPAHGSVRPAGGGELWLLSEGHGRAGRL